MIQITCKGNSAICTRTERLTSGMVGLQCEFVFDGAWDGLARTAVFWAGNEKRDVMLTGAVCTVPWEVLKTAGYQLVIGVYGTNAEGTLVIPTVYAMCGGIASGADPSGEESTDPSLPVWGQMQGMIGNLAELATTSKDNLVTAINEAAQSGGGGGGSLPFDEISGGNITEIDGKKVLTPLGGGALYKTKSFVSENIYPEYYGERSGSYGAFYDNYVDKPEAGKSYSVSVNGVQGEYVCFEDVDGATCLGTPYDDIVSDGQWLIKFYDDGTASFYLFLSEKGTYLSFVFSGEFKEYRKANANMLPTLPILLVDLDGFDLSGTGGLQDVPIYTVETFMNRVSLTQKQLVEYMSENGRYALIIDYVYNSFSVANSYFEDVGLNILKKKYNGSMEYIRVSFSSIEENSDNPVQAYVSKNESFKDSSSWTNI